jgi:chromosome segregation ATPase
MNRSMSASMTAEHSSQELDKLRHETQTLRRHLESSQRSVKETDGLQQELRIALDRNQRLEFDLRSVHDDLKEARAAVDSVGDLSAKMQEVRRQAVLQNQEMQSVMAAAMETAAQTENKLQHELLTAEQAQKTLADQAQRAATELKFLKQQLDSAQQQQEHVHLQNTDALKRMAESHVVGERLKNENATLVHRCDAQQHELALRDQENGDVCVRGCVYTVYECLYTMGWLRLVGCLKI